MFCPSCGTANSESRFCINCGSAVQPAVQPEFTGITVSNKKLKNVLALVGSVLLLGIIVVGVSVALTPNPLVEAVSSCSLDGSDGIELADGDETLIVDTEGNEDFSGASYDDLACLLAALNVPERIINSMNSTSSLDGNVTDSFDNINMSWRYHPDSGVNLAVSMN